MAPVLAMLALALAVAPPPGVDARVAACERRVEQGRDADPCLAELERDNLQLRQQRDILKKTLGILSEAPSSGFNGLRR